jgi:hypothetical protein
MTLTNVPAVATALVFAAICCVVPAAAQSARMVPGAQAAPQPVPNVEPPPIDPLAASQPRVEAVNVTLCKLCQTKARKRLGVMPVKVGNLPTELGLPGDLVAARLRDSIEGAVAQSSQFVVVNRSELGDVIAEQRLATSGAANRELAPALRAITPAQVLLYTTVDRIDASTKVDRKSSSNATEYHRRALELEQQSAAEMAAARRAANVLEDMQRSQDSSPAPTSMFGAGLKGLGNALLDAQRRKVTSHENTARRLQNEADLLRRQAETEARKEVTETKTTNLTVAVTWKAVDTSTGAVVASGAADASDTSSDEGRSTSSAFQSSESASSVRHDALVNSVLTRLIPALRREVESRLAATPFRAKVIKVDATGVFVNAGANLGLTVGDTFGARQRSQVLTDPDTGEVLTPPGPPIGALRIVEVFEKAARAQLIRAAGTIARGDELEWIGVFLDSGEAGTHGASR